MICVKVCIICIKYIKKSHHLSYHFLLFNQIHLVFNSAIKKIISSINSKHRYGFRKQPDLSKI